MFILGLTGSIGTGKSTVVQRLKDLAIPVHEADVVVHDLLSHDQTVINNVAALFPASFINGRIDRSKLASLVFTNHQELIKLEQMIHPRVQENRQAFLRFHKAAGTLLVVLDIPLLYEKGYDEMCNSVLVMTCGPKTQRQRVLMRPGMTEGYLAVITATQMPDEDKIKRATYVLDSEESEDQVFEKLELILENIQRLTY